MNDSRISRKHDVFINSQSTICFFCPFPFILAQKSIFAREGQKGSKTTSLEYDERICG